MAFVISPLFVQTKNSGKNRSKMVKTIVSKGQTILKRDSDYLDKVSHPSGRYDIGFVDLQKSHGPYLFTNKGKYYDATYSWMTDLLDPEKHKELSNQDYLSFLGKLAQEDRTPTEDKTAIQASFVSFMKSLWKECYRVLPVSAGGLATDDAMELAVGQVADKLGKNPIEMKGVAFEGAFHGRYGFGAEGTANKDKVGHLDLGRMVHVTSPIMQFNENNEIDSKKSEEVLSKSIHEVEEYFKKDIFAFVVVEYPIQAEGGARFVNPKTLELLNKLCNKYEKLLVVDCVQMGGRGWTIEKDFVSPFAPEVLKYADIITFGKVFHANGTLVRDLTNLNRGFKENWIDKYGGKRLGGTWTAHMSQMASGYAIMNTVFDKKLYLNVLSQSEYFVKKMEKMMKKYPKILSNVRGRKNTGYLAWSFFTAQSRDDFKKKMIEKEHIIFLTAGDNSIRYAPCADITKKEVDAILKAIENQIDKM